MEYVKNDKLKLSLGVIGGITLGAGGIVGVQAIQGPNATDRAIHTFEQKYTDAGKCLHDTPYDPAQGAFINVHYDSKSNVDILSAVPLAANSYQPSVLFFGVYPNERFISADQHTLAFIGNLACPDTSAGS